MANNRGARERRSLEILTISNEIFHPGSLRTDQHRKIESKLRIAPGWQITEEQGSAAPTKSFPQTHPRLRFLWKHQPYFCSPQYCLWFIKSIFYSHARKCFCSVSTLFIERFKKDGEFLLLCLEINAHIFMYVVLCLCVFVSLSMHVDVLALFRFCMGVRL